jgi:hypothetical protein
MSVPQNVQVTTLSPSSVLVSWDAVPGATSYTTAGSLGNPITTTRTSLQYDGIGTGVPYTFSVSSTTQSAFSPPININTLTALPIQPLVLTGFTPISVTSVSVQFTGGGGGSLLTLVDDVVSGQVTYNGGSVIITGLTTVQHDVQITSTNAGGSVSSNVIKVLPGVPPGPPAPTGLVASNVTSTGFVLAWNATPNTTSYSFLLNSQPASPTYVFPAATATFSGLQPSTSYSVQVVSRNAVGSTASVPLPVTTSPSPVSPPTAPTSLASSSVTSSSFVVSWTAGTGASSYSFTLNGTVVQPSYTFPATTATFNSLSASTPYSVVVTAVNSVGTAPSSPLSVTTSAAPPSNLLNIAAVGFLVPDNPGVFSPNSQWSINTSGSTQLGTWDLSTGQNTGDGAFYTSSLQLKGVKVILSLAGGAISNYIDVIPTGEDANDFISSMCYACLGIDCPNPWGWVRLNGLAFDGFDLDVEGISNPADFTSMTNLATKFRALCGTSKILTCAPQTPNVAANAGQSPIGLTNNGTVFNYPTFATPVSQITTGGQSLLSAGTYLNNFDYLFLQMYNQDVSAYPPSEAFTQLLSQWAYACKVSSTKLVLGIGTTDTGQGPPNIAATSWQNSQIPTWIATLNAVQTVLGAGQISDWCAGFGSYSSGYSTTSPSPSGLDAQAALRVIYTAGTGITNAPAAATILYNCLSTPSGVPPPDPLWTTLPIPAP